MNEELLFQLKKLWNSHQGRIFQNNYLHRIGDEIQTTAVYKYLKLKNIEIDYKDSNKHISALSIFPDNIVNFVNSNINQCPQIDFVNLWIWSPFLSTIGIHTQVSHQYTKADIEYECVFIPCLAPEYNDPRGIKNPEELFSAIKSVYKNAICIIDHNKKHLFGTKDHSVFYSDNIHTTFKFINKSKIFIGCDTGTSHYAGAIDHPNMFLLYPDEIEVQKRCGWQRFLISDIFGIPEIKEFLPTTYPCCKKQNYKSMIIHDKINPQNLARFINN